MPRERAALPTLALGLALVSSSALAVDAELGRDVYEEFCVTCHGKDLVNPGGVTFDLRKFPKDDFARFQASVLNGKGQGMPPWRGKVSDDDLKLLWAYLQSGG
jgi:mono/diheme cytochrome c family protein